MGADAQRPLGSLGILAIRQPPGGGVAGLEPVRVEGHVPGASQEAVDALDALRVPGTALVPGAHEHEEEAHRVRAVAGHQLVGVLDVAAALAHALAIGAQDLALVEEPA